LGLLGRSQLVVKDSLAIVWMQNEQKINGKMNLIEGKNRNYGVDYTGNETVKELPRSGALSKLTDPRWASAIHFAMGNPSPLPPSARERALSAR
jgi:hypothetical protein